MLMKLKLGSRVLADTPHPVCSPGWDLLAGPLLSSRPGQKDAVPEQLGQADAQHLFQFLPPLLHLEREETVAQASDVHKQRRVSVVVPHLGKDVPPHCLLGPGLVVESSSSLLLRIADHIGDDLQGIRRKATALASLSACPMGWESSQASHGLPLRKQDYTLRSRRWERSHSWMKSWGSVLKLSMKSLWVFSWLIDSMVSWIWEEECPCHVALTFGALFP